MTKTSKIFNLLSTSIDNFDDTVSSFLNKSFGTNSVNYSHSQVFKVIFDGMKGITQNIMFYIEDALNEQNIFTASRKSSVYNLAKVSGYEPYYGSAAVGNVLINVILNNGLSSSATKVIINNWTKIINKNTGYIYSISLSTDSYTIDLSKPLTIVEFKVIEGSYMESNYVATGDSFEVVTLSTMGLVDTQYFEVYVDNVKYTRVYNLYDMEENGEQYVINIGYDNSFDIMFGNGVYGKKLLEGQSITVKYLKHSGESGNIKPSESSDFIFAQKCYDTLGNEVDANEFLSISVKNCISGGTNSDTISFIKNMIGYNSRSLVLASADNFKLFLKRFSFVGYVNCWSEPNSMAVSITCIRNYKKDITSVEDFYNISSLDSILLNNDEKIMIQQSLNNSNKSFAGISINFIDPIVRKFAFIFTVKTDSIFNKDVIKNSIKTTLYEYFLNLKDETTFIAKSDIIKHILNNCENIVSIDVNIISEMQENSYYNGYYENYDIKNINGKYQYISSKVMYNSQKTAGLDDYGNISLSSKLEIPMLMGYFNYYINKEHSDKSSFIKIQPIQIFFT